MIWFWFIDLYKGVVSAQVFSPYCVTKYGVEAFGDSLRREMRRFNVQVSVIEPGAKRTPLLQKSEVLTDGLKALWNKLSEEKKREYGEDYIEDGKKWFYLGVVRCMLCLKDWGTNLTTTKVTFQNETGFENQKFRIQRPPPLVWTGFSPCSWY